MNQMRYDILLLAMIALICVSPAHAEPLTDSSAVARAEAFMGFQNAFQVKSFTFDSLPDTKALDSLPLPYLEDKANLNIVSVTAHDVRLTGGDWCKTPRDFTVYLDADSGTFLVATSYSDAVKTPLLKPFKKEGVERYFWSIFTEFQGYATNVPRYSLTDVLRQARRSRPCSAPGVYIYCIGLSLPALESGTYWCVIGRGLPILFQPIHGRFDPDELVDIISLVDVNSRRVRGLSHLE